MKFISYPSIEQYRNVVKNISKSACYVGHDDEIGKDIYNNLLPKPIVRFKGTVKLHGTNASVCYNDDSGFWMQSRNNIITPEKDNAGFASFVHSRIKSFQRLINEINYNFHIDHEKETVSIFGEWCGQGVQKGVAISKIEKMFVIFGVKISPINEDFGPYWLSDKYKLSSPEDKIFDINEFGTFEMEIDFNKPEEYQNTLNGITSKVEEECPVAAYFGIKGIGEGVVWKGAYRGDNYRFKVKGEKHSKTKVKKLPQVDDAKNALINETVNKVTPSFRLEQGVQEVFNTLNGGDIDRKKLGDYIRWVIGDIMKEDLDLIAEAGLQPKEINAKISKVVKDYFFSLEQF
jgi:hypothetical protein